MGVVACRWVGVRLLVGGVCVLCSAVASVFFGGWGLPRPGLGRAGVWSGWLGVVCGRALRRVAAPSPARPTAHLHTARSGVGGGVCGRFGVFGAAVARGGRAVRAALSRRRPGRFRRVPGVGLRRRPRQPPFRESMCRRGWDAGGRSPSKVGARQPARLPRLHSASPAAVGPVARLAGTHRRASPTGHPKATPPKHT